MSPSGRVSDRSVVTSIAMSSSVVAACIFLPIELNTSGGLAATLSDSYIGSAKPFDTSQGATL